MLYGRNRVPPRGKVRIEVVGTNGSEGNRRPGTRLVVLLPEITRSWGISWGPSCVLCNLRWRGESKVGSEIVPWELLTYPGLPPSSIPRPSSTRRLPTPSLPPVVLSPYISDTGTEG